jgi:hypothetical protein
MRSPRRTEEADRAVSTEFRVPSVYLEISLPSEDRDALDRVLEESIVLGFDSIEFLLELLDPPTQLRIVLSFIDSH